MPSLDDFSEITLLNEPLAKHTWLGVGGPAQYFIEPRNFDELRDVVRCCHETETPIHILGGGSNVLVRDEGVSGVVVHFKADNFSDISFEGSEVRVQAGALLSNVISRCIQEGLGGLETLAGIPGTIGGAISGNAGGNNGDIGQFVKEVRVLTSTGEIKTRTAEEVSFSYRQSTLTDLVVLETLFSLKKEEPDEISQRMRKTWIMKKATQPLSFQSAGCIFRNPRGTKAGALIEQAGLKGTRVGNVEISDRHANFFVTQPGATAEDILKLIDLTRSKVSEQHGIDLELEIKIW
ncbi:UDP-N-acetylenolpyruvoylglucosamine reductase MurB [Polystyrenella longa]|uniref:UDP-N-acetylenolpyruvoylglucosamine reductase n=1 Tax=Polystyrenella longa TaxID=2528007 RepID=A0A518CS11_9PLAN|nr:UDP-N-acetylmuramate dehydrogenase [Polystyrenella longa]QDU82005.1 UDP-N-acetylenolpyruvoylglucosamine reductase MurB [Polystyrenella longa]